MRKNIFAVCDLEAAYAYNLMEYINTRQNTPFEVQAFTSVKSLEVYVKNHEIELLLISCDAMCEEVKGIGIKKILILSEGEVVDEFCDYPNIYKYQSSDSLIAEVMGYYATQSEAVPVAMLKKKVNFIGVYSPEKHALQTSFSLTLGKILSKSRSVLYLNMEGFSGFQTLMKKEYPFDLSDLMYFIKQGNANAIYKLDGMVQSFHNLDYVPPAFSPFDIKAVEYEDWMRLFGDLTAYSAYDTIILDLSDLVDGLFQILMQCTKIYMPIKDDMVSEAKRIQFERLLGAWNGEEVYHSIKMLRLPPGRDRGKEQSYEEHLMWGEMGEYVSRILQEDMSE